METTELYLANGMMRRVKGRAEDIGAALRARKLGEDDGYRQFVTLDGETITVNARGGVLLAEAGKKTREAKPFGFAQALEA